MLCNDPVFCFSLFPQCQTYRLEADQSGLAGLCNSDLLVVLVMTGIKKPTADCNAVRDEFRFLERLSDEMLEIHFHL